MLDTIARKLIPTRVRQALGSWTLRQASRSTLLLKPYLYLIHGYNMENLSMEGNDAIYNYLGYKIRAPKDGIGSFFEVFQEEVYDGKLKIREGDTVIDVGAYVGMFTVKAALLVGMTGTVVAVEPDALNFKYLEENCKNLKNVIPVQKALSNGVEEKDFYLSTATACHSLVYKQRTKIRLKTDTLDNVVRGLPLPGVNFIKIDAEGSELEVLRGAEEPLKNKGIKLAIASYHYASETSKIISFLRKRNFEVEVDSGLRRYIYAQKSN